MGQILIVENIGQLVTLEGAVEKHGRGIIPSDLGVIKDATLVLNTSSGGKILWAGGKSTYPSKIKALLKKSKVKKYNAKGGTVIPGFVDSHTHLVFDGDRSLDFERRLQGWTYQKIAAEGGGILTSMAATRKISKKDLFKKSLARVTSAKKQGITTMEIKTGYGLNFQAEKKCLDVITQLKKKSSLTIKSTFLGAHAVPPEYKGKKSDYVNVVTHEWLPKLKKQIDFVDIFLDQGFFDQQDADKLLNKAKKLNLKIKIHADEIALTGGTQMAVKYQALSADHLLKITEKEIMLLAKSEVTATLLPTTASFLLEENAPARQLLASGARVALATDFNPGTSPSQDISLTALFAALNLKMRPEEILVSLTLNGAYALGLEKSKGALLPGYDGDFIVLPSQSLTGFFYQFGKSAIERDVFISGQLI